MARSALCGTGPRRKARQGRWFFPLCLAFFLLLAAVSGAFGEAEGNPYLVELAARAEAMQLHRDRYWQILLHYKPTSGGGVESLIDDPRFFLAAGGKHDPAAELAATLAAMFGSSGEGEEDPRCRFVARTAWLRDRLAIDGARLPPAPSSSRPWPRPTRGRRP